MVRRTALERFGWGSRNESVGIVEKQNSARRAFGRASAIIDACVLSRHFFLSGPLRINLSDSEVALQSVDRRGSSRLVTDHADMDPALASLLGVAIGGGIASGSSVWLENRRQLRDEAATETRDRAEAVRAARLFLEELDAGRRLLEADRSRGIHTWEPPERQLPAATWTQYRADFARVAPQGVWEATSEAYARFDALSWHKIAVVREDRWTGAEPHHPLEARSLGPKSLELTLEGIGTAELAIDLLHGVIALGKRS